MGLKEIVSFTAVSNLRSRHVMKRIGMIYDPRSDFDHPLRANISETSVVLSFSEQGEKEKGRDELSWCSFLGQFGWRGTERRRA
jgi:RimJ/RimL family protein N-acetyltransferase